MEVEFRSVIENIKLTKDEAKTLSNAKKILQNALQMVFNLQCQYDEDLVEAINDGIDGLKKCNPRLNVGVITGDED